MVGQRPTPHFGSIDASGLEPALGNEAGPRSEVAFGDLRAGFMVLSSKSTLALSGQSLALQAGCVRRVHHTLGTMSKP
jgi:hypothetical protein